MDTLSAPFGDLRSLAPSFRRSLKAGNKSERTIKIYMTAADRLVGFLEESSDTRGARVSRMLERLKAGNSNETGTTVQNLRKVIGGSPGRG